MNPRRKRRRRYARNDPGRPRRRRGGYMRRRSHGRRRYRRNPPMGRGIMGTIQASMPAVGWGTVGFLGTSLVPGWASRFNVPIPDKAANPMMYYGVKAISAFAVGWMVKAFAGSRQAAFALAGGGINIIGEAVGQFAGPALGVGEYLEPGVSEYLEPGQVGYLSPGEPLSGFATEFDEPVARLNPDNRF